MEKDDEIFIKTVVKMIPQICIFKVRLISGAWNIFDNNGQYFILQAPLIFGNIISS